MGKFDSLWVAAFCPRPSQVLADLLADTVLELEKIVLSSGVVGHRQHGVPVAGIDVPEHGAAKMMYVEGGKKILPAVHPFITCGIQHHGRVSFVLAARMPSAGFPTPAVLESHLPPVLFDPMVALMLIVCEESRRGVFTESGGHGQATGSSADDEDIMDVSKLISHVGA